MFAKHLSTKAFSSATATKHAKIAVVGAGCGGQSLIAQLARSGKIQASDITVFEPNAEHHYQAAYTMVAGGVFADAKTTKSHYEQKHIVREQNELFAHTPGINWR